MHQPRPCLSVVMPCFNEVLTVKEVAERVLDSPWTAELVVVDDGSTDGTLDVVRGLADPRVRVLVQPVNRGKGAALRRGLAAARSEFVVVQDADLEYDPDEYAWLLEPLLDGKADVVYGSRFHSSRPHRVLYFWHSVGNRFLTTVSNMFTNLNLTDMETCYKAFRREVLDGLVIEEDRFGFEPEITAKVARRGWRIYEVGISYAGRTYAEGKKIGWRDGVRALYCIVRYSPLVDRPPSPRPVAAPEEADAALGDVLQSLEGAPAYRRWIADLAAPHLGDDVLEVGAGHGGLTDLLRRPGRRVVAADPSARCEAVLRRRFDGDPAVEVRRADLLGAAAPGAYDSALAVNVLEHVDDDGGAVAALAAAVRPGGTVVLFVPASERLYSEFDRRIGHHRRYRRRHLERLLVDAGLVPVEVRHVNAVGALAWWLVARRMGGVPTSGGWVAAFDRLVPVLRRSEASTPPPVGLSLLAVGRRPET